MKVLELLENDDLGGWEPELEPTPKREINVRPVDGATWTGWTAASLVFNQAFGSNTWSISDIPAEGTARPITVYLKDAVDLSNAYRILKKHGIKVLFLEAVRLDNKGSTTYTEKDLPRYIRLGDGYHLHRNAEPYFVSYDIKRMLEDDKLGKVDAIVSPGGDAQWRITVKPADGAATRFADVTVSKGQLYNHLKLKWWAKNRLIEAGWLPPIKEAKSGVPSPENNYNFRPEYRQFRFQIHDLEKFKGMSVQPGFKKATVDNRFVEKALQDVMIKQQPGVGPAEGWTLLMHGALKGNNPHDAPMVLMFDPLIVKPDTKKLKEYGMKPVFLENHDAY